MSEKYPMLTVPSSPDGRWAQETTDDERPLPRALTLGPEDEVDTGSLDDSSLAHPVGETRPSPSKNHWGPGQCFRLPRAPTDGFRDLRVLTPLPRRAGPQSTDQTLLNGNKDPSSDVTFPRSHRADRKGPGVGREQVVSFEETPRRDPSALVLRDGRHQWGTPSQSSPRSA